MTKLLACVGCTLGFKDPAHTGTIAVSAVGAGSLGSKCKCSGAQAYTLVAFTVTGASNGAGITAGTGAGSISGTATKIKCSGTAPVRYGDEVTITITGTGGGSPATYSATVFVDDAGQDAVWGE